MKDVDTFLALAQEHKKNAQYAGQVIETPKGQSPHLDITARFKDGSNEQQFKLFA